VLSTSCQKEFVMPEKEVEPDSLNLIMPNPDSARINFIWVKTFASQIGARLELRNDTGAILMNAIDMIQNNDSIFQFEANKGINLKKYILTVKTPNGSILDTLHYNFTYQEDLDEIIIERPNVKYYLQISWLYRTTIED
jgi:hypothetical protein